MPKPKLGEGLSSERRHSLAYWQLWPLSPVLLLLQKIFRTRDGIGY